MTWYDISSDTTAYKARLMANYNELKTGAAITYTTTERLALTPTVGTMAYDSSLTTLFAWDGTYWVAV